MAELEPLGALVAAGQYVDEQVPRCDGCTDAGQLYWYGRALREAWLAGYRAGGADARQVADSLAARVAAQSELLAKRAESARKQP